METPAEISPPSHITTQRYRGQKWPPNRPDNISSNALKHWKQQDPTIKSIARRPMPKNFVRAFSILGWREAPWYYRCSWRVVGRWVNEAGKETVLAERAAMRRNPDREKLKSQMTAYWNSEPREPAWLLSPQ
jgi:hypothetical protein